MPTPPSVSSRSPPEPSLQKSHTQSTLGLPPLLELFGAQPTHLLVDTENLRMGYEKEAAVYPERYRNLSLDDLTHGSFPRIVRELAVKHKVPSDCVHLVGKSRSRVLEVFGSIDEKWRIVDPGTGQRTGSNDDAALARQVGWMVGNDPRVSIVVLTGDGNLALVLNDGNRPRNLYCYSPFEMSRSLIDQAPSDWRLQSNLFRNYNLRKPAEVSEAAYRRAIANGRPRSN